MKKFKVDYTIFDCHECSHVDREEIVEAASIEEAKEKISSRSSMSTGDYHVNKIEEVL